MPTDKPKYAFYADDDVREIIESWGEGSRSREINAAIREYATKHVTTEKRLLRLEKDVKEIKRRLDIWSRAVPKLSTSLLSQLFKWEGAEHVQRR